MQKIKKKIIKWLGYFTQQVTGTFSDVMVGNITFDDCTVFIRKLLVQRLIIVSLEKN